MKHSPLATLQAQFINDLLTGSQESAVFIKQGRLSPAAHLSVYQDSTQAILISILKDFYGVTHKLVGEAFFNAMALQFVKKSPPASGNMDLYGGNFPTFVAGFPPAQSLPYLADVTRLEWARHLAFIAPKAPRIVGEGLLKFSQGDVVQELLLHPSVGLIASPFPVLRIWEANQEENIHESETINLDDAGEQNVLVYRQAGRVVLQALHPWQFDLLKAVGQGVPLAGAIEAALLLEPAENIQGFLARCIHMGLFAEHTEASKGGKSNAA
jgi:hypothetical protein